MNINRAIEIINLNPTESDVSEKETLEAYKVFFQSFGGVNIQNKDGSYKRLYKVLEEAAMNIKNGK